MPLIMAIVPQRFHDWCQARGIEETDKIMLWRTIQLTDQTGNQSWFNMPEEMRWSYAHTRYETHKHTIQIGQN